jgi:hypothetical protein
MLVGVPVISVWARTEKLAAAPKSGFVAACTETGPVKLITEEKTNTIKADIKFL